VGLAAGTYLLSEPRLNVRGNRTFKHIELQHFKSRLLERPIGLRNLVTILVALAAAAASLRLTGNAIPIAHPEAVGAIAAALGLATAAVIEPVLNPAEDPGPTLLLRNIPGAVRRAWSIRVAVAVGLGLGAGTIAMAEAAAALAVPVPLDSAVAAITMVPIGIVVGHLIAIRSVYASVGRPRRGQLFEIFDPDSIVRQVIIGIAFPVYWLAGVVGWQLAAGCALVCFALPLWTGMLLPRSRGV